MNSIGDFAEKLILGQVDDVVSGKALAPSLEEAASKSGSAPAKDIRHIEVPEDMMKEILGEGYTQDEPAFETKPELVWTDPQGEPEPAPVPQPLTEETGSQLVSLMEELKTLVTDLKEMSGAMSTAGGMGCNLGGPGLDTTNSKYTGRSSKRKKKEALSAALRKKR